LGVPAKSGQAVHCKSSPLVPRGCGLFVTILHAINIKLEIHFFVTMNRVKDCSVNPFACLLQKIVTQSLAAFRGHAQKL
jgi:hypothetical protein